MPDSVCLQQFAASANPQAHEQGRRSRSSPHVPVISGSPVLRGHRLRRPRPGSGLCRCPVGGWRLRSGSDGVENAAFFGRPSTAARDRAFRKCGGGGGGVRDWALTGAAFGPCVAGEQTLALDLLPSFGPGIVILASKRRRWTCACAYPQVSENRGESRLFSLVSYGAGAVFVYYPCQRLGRSGRD